jgi:hypothetical protein
MPATRRAGVAAMLAGALYFAGQGGEIFFGGLPESVFIVLGACGLLALGVALWEFRKLMVTRRGRVGIWIALAGFVFLALFAVQLLVVAIRTGDVTENFALFGIGFLLVLVGQLLYAYDLRYAVGYAWVLPLVAVVGLIAALSTEWNIIHDGGLFVFEAAWVALGVALLRR